MRKEHVLGILFFSGLWGLCESVLGGALYGGGSAHLGRPNRLRPRHLSFCQRLLSTQGHTDGDSGLCDAVQVLE